MSQKENKDHIESLLRHAHLNIGDIEKVSVDNQLISKPRDYDNPVMEFLDFMANPENFWFTCKYLLNVDLLPFQLCILQELWERKFPMLIATRGAGKTWILALYSLLRAFFHQGCKIIVIGAAFRQSKLLFEYMETFYKNSPVFRNMVGAGRGQGPKRDIDRCTFYVGQSEIIAIPLGDGSKIRGLRANYIVADEFASIPQEIFEVVIKGFGAVSANPADKVKEYAQIQKLKELGMHEEAEEIEGGLGFGNQTIIAGTAYYAFNHFYEYFVRQREIVRSKGDEKYLEENVFKGKIPDGFDWTHYSVMRIPEGLLPEGFLDKSQLAQAKAMLHASRYDMEYEACFAKDSEGFFRRSLVERCVTTEPVTALSGEEVSFNSMIIGNPNKKYVYGIDPASENDNFSIVVLEQNEDHSRVVYVWTCSRQVMRERIKTKKESRLESFYTYCARKILDLMKIFPTNNIAIDAQGGGIAIMEALHDNSTLRKGENPVWPYVKHDDKDPFYWESKDKPTDGEAGLHILHMIQFAKSEFTFKANHNLRKDLETQNLLFPKFDTILLSEAITDDKLSDRHYDTLEDCVMEIESLKDELATIEHTQTSSGRDKWDTPQTVGAGGKKGRLRKDRYSALLMANEVCHSLSNQLEGQEHKFTGGYAQQNKEKIGGQLYTGPDHLVKRMNGIYGMGVRRK
tara:strand:- start:2441 stop:4492 length:2052 start_codon:yes stop_codon:yes gene_type:complete